MTSYDPNQYPSDGYAGQPYSQDQGYPGQPYSQDQGYPGQAYPQGQAYPGQAYPQDQGYPGQAYQGQPLYPMMAQNTEKNSLGVWSVSLGAASLLCCGVFTGIPAAIVGFLGLQAANEGRANNKVLSIIGMVTGIASIGLTFVWYAFGLYDSILY